MKYKKFIWIGIIFIALFFTLTILVSNDSNLVKLGLCDYAESTCTYYFHEGVTVPIVLGLTSLFLTMILMLFVREETFKSWRKFAYFAIPISIIFLWLAPTTTPGGFGIS